MIKVLLTTGGTTKDYTRNFDQASLKIVEQINVSTQAQFDLFPLGRFTPPVARTYVQIYSDRWERSLFTGFLVSEPVKEFLDLSRAAEPGPVPAQTFRYTCTASSDDYILNVKSVPFIPAFINRKQGQILRALADILCPGFFDTTQIQDGDLVPYFAYDPSQSYMQIAKKFGDASRYRFKARDRVLYYAPYGDLPLGITYDERRSQSTFNAKDLKTQVMVVPPVNDVTIVGDVEAGNNREDYVIGDGFTGNFLLNHKVFRGGSVVLLQETWNSLSLNTQQWDELDPGTNFDLSAGALNVLTPSGQPFDFGQSYIDLKNGLELAGGLNLEHGEYTFNDYCDGLIGFLYEDSTFGASGQSFDASGNIVVTAPSGLIGGYVVTSPSGIIAGASVEQPAPGNTTVGAAGCSGVFIQPWWAGSGFSVGDETATLMYVDGISGTAVGDPIVTDLNQTFVLQTLISSPQYVRYRRIYRTLDGVPYGGVETEVFGSVTFVAQIYDIFAASGLFYQPTVIRRTIQNVQLPAFAAYAVVNNRALNLAVNNTNVAQMPLGTLAALTGPEGLAQPTGVILPHLPPNSGWHDTISGYIGPVPPWPSLASGNIEAPPEFLKVLEQQEVLGNGFQLQAAQITPGNSADTLGFYDNSLPAVGTRVRLQTWEAQAARSRIQDRDSIDNEAFVVGDDGLRSAIVQDLNPLPRTSEDCDNAALAFLADRTKTAYNGTYTAYSDFFQGLTSDLQFWPTVGRFLNIHAPKRGIDEQKYLVTGLTITLLDMKTEELQFQIQFGADLYIDKTLAALTPNSFPGILTPKDTANPPNPRFTFEAASTYLPDLEHVTADPLGITEANVVVNVKDNYFGQIEVRRQDTNWGRGNTPDLIAIVRGQQFSLRRTQFDQQWFMRPVAPVSGAGFVGVTGNLVEWESGEQFLPWRAGTPIQLNGQQSLVAAVNDSKHLQLQLPATDGQTIPYLVNLAAQTSRRSKVLRVRYPLKPSPPLLQSVGIGTLQFDYSGDVRSIYGFELRTPPVSGASGNDAGQVVLWQRPATSIADMNVDLYNGTPYGALFGTSGTPVVYAYFFNHMWGYSDPLVVSGAFPGTPPFEVRKQGYAMLDVAELRILNNQEVALIRALNFTAPSIDDTDNSWGLLGSMSATGDKQVIAASGWGTSRFGNTVGVGDYIVWNKPPYEIDKVIGITGGNYELERRPSGAAVGIAQFGSAMSAHTDELIFWLGSPKTFPEAIKKDALAQNVPTTQSGLPSHWEWAWANKTVLAVACQAVGDSSASPAYTVNLAVTGISGSGPNGPPCPGLRTMNGAAYTNLGVSGDLFVGMNALVPIRPQAWESLRVVYGFLQSGASGSGLSDYSEIYVAYVPSDLSNAYLLDILRFGGNGTLNSFPSSDPPDGRLMPYHVSWPGVTIGPVTVPDYPPTLLPLMPNMLGPIGAQGPTGALLLPDTTVQQSVYTTLAPDGYIGFVVTKVASMSPGNTPVVVVQT